MIRGINVGASVPLVPARRRANVTLKNFHLKDLASTRNNIVATMRVSDSRQIPRERRMTLF